MPIVAPTVWTAQRKWMGNLIPIMFWLPFVVYGVLSMVQSGQIFGIGLASLGVGTVLAWLAVNQFGFWQNKAMKRQLLRILQAKGVSTRDAVFVGIATPKFSSTIDPHEDVGYLMFHPDRISFHSETRTIDLLRSSLKIVRFRPNVHSLLGLGRWISLEGESDGKPIRLLVEPRERTTLLSNRIYGKKLLQRVRRWMAEA